MKDFSQKHEVGYNAILTSLVIIGIMLIWSSSKELVLGVSEYSAYSYDMSECILSVLLLSISFICLYRGQNHAAVVSLTVVLFFMTRMAKGALGDSYGIGILCIPFVLIMSANAIVSIVSDRKVGGTATILAAIAFLFEGCSFPGSIIDLIMFLSGTMFLLMGLKGFIAIRRIDPGMSEQSLGTMSDIVPGLVLMGIHGSIIALSSVGGVSCVLAIGMSIIIVMSAVVVMSRGSLLFGTLQFMYGFGSMISFVPMSMGADVFLLGAVFWIPVTICGFLFVARDKAIGAVTVLFGIVGMLAAFNDSEMYGRMAYAIVGFGCSVIAVRYMIWNSMMEKPPIFIRGQLIQSNVLTFGGFVFSCMLLLMAVVQAYASINPMTDDTPMDAVILISACSVMVMSVIAARAQMITESIILMISGCSFMIFTVADMTFMNDGLILLSAFMAFGLIVGAYISFVRGNRRFCIGIVAVAFILLAKPVGLAIPSFTACVISGTIFAVLSAKRMVLFDSCGSAVRDHVCRQPDMQYSVTLMKTLGMFLTTLLCMMYDLNTVGPDQYEGLEVTRMVICIVLIGIGVFVTMKGFGPAGVFITITSLFGFTSSFMSILGLHMPGEFQLVIASALVPVFYSLFMSGDRVMFLLAFVVFLISVLNPLMDSITVLVFADFIMKVVSCFLATVLWIRNDSGRKLFDSVSEWLNSKGKVRKTNPPDAMRSVWSLGFMMVAMGCIWFGHSLMSLDPSDANVMFPSFMLSLAIIMMSACMMFKGMYVDGLFVFSTGVMFIALSFETDLTDPVILVALFCSAVAALMEGRKETILVSALFLSFICVLNLSDNHVGGLFLITIGLPMLISAVVRQSGYLSSPKQCGDYCTTAMLVTAIAAMVYVMPFYTGSLLISGLIASSFASVMSFIMIMRGSEIDSLYTMSISVPCIGYCLLNLLDVSEGTIPLMTSLSLLVAGCAFAREKRCIPAFSCIVCMSMMFAFIVTGERLLCISCGIIFAVITIIYVMIPGNAPHETETAS